MAIAVSTALSALRTSLRNAGKQVELDRASALARSKMAELRLSHELPALAPIGGVFAPAYTGGREAGWTAVVVPFEPLLLPLRVGAPVLERIQLEVWWRADAGRQTLRLEAYRASTLTAAELDWAGAHQNEMVGLTPAPPEPSLGVAP
jgi:hypothetical protein